MINQFTTGSTFPTLPVRFPHDYAGRERSRIGGVIEMQTFMHEIQFIRLHDMFPPIGIGPAGEECYDGCAFSGFFMGFTNPGSDLSTIWGIHKTDMISPTLLQTVDLFVEVGAAFMVILRCTYIKIKMIYCIQGMEEVSRGRPVTPVRSIQSSIHHGNLSEC